jgi:hypothetical protein
MMKINLLKLSLVCLFSLTAMGCIVNEESDGCDCTCDYYARKLDLQDEAGLNLDAIFTAEVAYFGEQNTYGHTFADIGFQPLGEWRYAYFIDNDVLQPSIAMAYPLPSGIELETTISSFNAVAVGNIDCDDTLDVWSIDQYKNLTHLVDDLTK